MTDDQDADLLCATYTHARRHPMVLGTIGGWTPPFQLSLTQIVVILVVFFVEIETWRFWGSSLPPLLALFVAVTLPGVMAWGVRRPRVEGRSLPRFALGWLHYMSAPRCGAVGGRPFRPARPAAPFRSPIYVAALVDKDSGP